MPTISQSTTIARPPEEVFAYLDDLAAHTEWQDGVESVKVLTEGPTKVGTEVEESRKVGNRQVQMRWRVTAHEPPRRSAFETIESKMVKPSGVIVVAPSGEGSDVTFEMDPKPQGIGKLLSPFITRDIRKTVAGDLERLKRRLEGNSA